MFRVRGGGVKFRLIHVVHDGRVVALSPKIFSPLCALLLVRLRFPAVEGTCLILQHYPGRILANPNRFQTVNPVALRGEFQRRRIIGGLLVMDICVVWDEGAS